MTKAEVLNAMSCELSRRVGMDPGRTVSSQAYEQAQAGQAWAIALCAALDQIEPDHCRLAWERDEMKTPVSLQALPQGVCSLDLAPDQCTLLVLKRALEDYDPYLDPRYDLEIDPEEADAKRSAALGQVERALNIWCSSRMG